VLAARSENLGIVALTMAAFGVGAALPLLAVELMSSEVLSRWRDRLLGVGAAGKIAMGAALVAVGVFILTGSTGRSKRPWSTPRRSG
jgi:cytochrome c-type biogenesis protein